MKVSLYVRQRGTRKQTKHNPKKSYPQDGSIIWVLRYGTTWETLDVKSLIETTTLRLRRQIELDGGWRPITKVTLKAPIIQMLDKALDGYLAEIEKSRKPKTYDCPSPKLWPTAESITYNNPSNRWSGITASHVQPAFSLDRSFDSPLP